MQTYDFCSGKSKYNDILLICFVVSHYDLIIIEVVGYFRQLRISMLQSE